MIRMPDAVSLPRADRAVRLDVGVRPVDERRIVVAVVGDLDLATAPALKTGLLEPLAQGYCELVLDLSGVGHMDSTGLAVLIGVRERLRDGGRVVLAAAPPSVRRVLEVTGLTSQFELAETVEEVVGPLSEPLVGTRQGGLTADAQIALGLLATALPFAESRRAEAERWLRVLQAHGDTARILAKAGVRESADPSTRRVENAVYESAPDRRDPVQQVVEHARRLAAERGVNLIGTIELLAAAIEVYGSDFDELLSAHGSTRGAVRKSIEEESFSG